MKHYTKDPQKDVYINLHIVEKLNFFIFSTAGHRSDKLSV